MHFSDYQAAFAARIRDPKLAPRPAGASAKRMRVYEELLFNNLEGFLLACYPVTRNIFGARVWKQTARRFFSEHRCHSPLFRDIPKAFLDWMEERGTALFPALPFLAEFMHYEWLELAVSVSPDDPDPAAVEPSGDLLQGRPALNPSAHLACYHYPVHRIGPRYQPGAPDPQAHCYLLFRDETDTVRFIQLNPLSARLLELLREQRPSGREALARLAKLAGPTDPAQHERFIQAGGDLLRDLRGQGALLGTWRTS
ncbi:MAG: putative DNA-binding domain-containing protein [Gallionellaceae bacterium]|nr:putative DNA-binding domain-containing protein [Gallionellaceae bacterium]